MLRIFVNTWGNYNVNGADGGRWIDLPMEGDELSEALEEIAEAMGDHDPEWFVNDYEWDCGYYMGDIGENENLAELNEYAQQLDAIWKWDLDKYAAMVENWGRDYIDPNDIDDYVLHTDINSDYDLGYYWVHESGCYDLSSMGSLANYIDYEAFGRDIRFETDGGFTAYGWVERC